MLSVKNIEKSFGDKKVLDGISLTVNQGDVVVILGPSGSGKTTFLRSLNYLEKADAGELILDGKTYDLAKISRKDVLEIRKKTAFVFQNYNLFANKTAIENILEGLVIARKIPKEEAIPIAENALKKVGLLEKSGDTRGDFRYNNHTYSYLVTDESDDSTLIVVLDSTNQVEENITLVHLSLWMSGVSFAFFFLMVSIFSGRVIEPFIRNYERQRRFITNAGHELKTPLAIISANNELVEMMNGESEWTKSTNDQVERMTGLINSLVAMARLEEQPEVVLTDLNFSAIAEDAAEDFKGPVIKDGKQFVMEIQPDIHVKAEEKSLFELVTLLVDNANKYCDAGGTVSVKLSKANRLSKARLEISNTYAEGKNVDYSKFFERFYREDESHNNKKSGYGIGLSMAQTMVKLFKGSISVSYSGDTITFLVSL